MTRLLGKGRLHRTQENGTDVNSLLQRLVTLLAPDSVAAEAYRTLRTNLLYAFVDDPPRVIVLTSPGPSEGKSTTCANLGVVLAQAGKRVLAMDCDLRKPVLHHIFGTRNIAGVVDVLAGQHDLPGVWHEPVEGLKLVNVGPVPPNPSELLSSKRFTNLLSQVRQEFDYVLVDAPPTELVTDAAVIATQADGVLLVLDAQKTPKRVLRRSIGSMETVGARVLGTVMNNAQVSKSGYYNSYTYKY